MNKRELPSYIDEQSTLNDNNISKTCTIYELPTVKLPTKHNRTLSHTPKSINNTSGPSGKNKILPEKHCKGHRGEIS